MAKGAKRRNGRNWVDFVWLVPRLASLETKGLWARQVGRGEEERGRKERRGGEKEMSWTRQSAGLDRGRTGGRWLEETCEGDFVCSVSGLARLG